jgi:hypothetical protein
MNERYEQLMAQAWIEFAPDAKAVTKRFAELIVRECASKAWFVEQYGIGDGTPVSKQIKEHFGVEE